MDISITRLIRRLTEIQETALAHAQRPAVRGKTRPCSVHTLAKMDAEQGALFEALNLVRFQHS
jgi:hypothetical protein